MQISKPSLKIGGWELVAGAAILLTISFCFYRQAARFMRSASRASGTVVRVVERSGRGSGMVYYPVFTFTDAKGQAHEINMSFGESVPFHNYKVGDTVTVIYQPLHPEAARLYSFFDVWGSAAMMGGPGAVGLVVGIGMLVAALVMRKPEQESPAAQVA